MLGNAANLDELHIRKLRRRLGQCITVLEPVPDDDPEPLLGVVPNQVHLVRLRHVLRVRNHGPFRLECLQSFVRRLIPTVIVDRP